jgi:hypothetical protein
VPKDGLVYKINNNNGKLFNLGKLSQSKDEVHQEGSVCIDAMREGHKKNNHFVDSKPYAFVASKTTGLLTIRPEFSTKTIDLSSKSQCMRTAFLSWGHLILKSAADFLAIDSDELDLNVRYGAKGYEVVLVERLENGAGYCNHLSGDIQEHVPHVVFLKSLLPGGFLYEKLITDQHAHSCQGSCYDCLRNYYNQNEHYLLDWRLGLDMARLSSDPNTSLHMKESYWVGYLETLNKQFERQRFGVLEEKSQYYILQNEKPKLVTHPLWTSTYIDSIKDEVGITSHINLFEIVREIVATK